MILSTRPWPSLAVALVLCAVSWNSAAAADDKRAADLLADDVRLAIDRGASYLYTAMDKNPPRGSIAAAYPMGFRAIAAYALLEAGTPADAPLIQRLFREMEALPLDKVYAVAIYAMALDALKRKLGDGGGAKGTNDAIKEKLERVIGWIVNARSIPRGVWGYGGIGKDNPFEWIDFSNTQFAVLALQVGMRNGILPPDAVLKEIAFGLKKSTLARTDGPGEIFCEGGGWWTDSQLAAGPLEKGVTAVARQGVTLREGGFLLRVEPIEWPYKPTWAASSGSQHARYSMTAAATSSLMVAREGLARRRKLNDSEREELDRLIAGGILALRRGYTSLDQAGFASLFRNYYYDLYSFEKAMDLGGIVRLDGIDWYREQASVLVLAQRTDGAWGSARAEDSEYDVVSTCFALLFLRRATRNLLIEPPAPILTAGADGKGQEPLASGKVFLPSRNGMVDIAELFQLLASARTAEYLALAREVFDVVPPVVLPELLPHVALARNGTGDSVDALAQKQVATISGLAGNAPEEHVAQWVETWRFLRSLDAGAVASIARVEQIITDPEATGPLVVAAIDALVRINSLDVVPVVLDTLESPFVEGRESAARALPLLVPHTAPFDAAAPRDQRGSAAYAWRDYWRQNEGTLRFRRSWDRLRQELGAARDPAQRARLRNEIAALGPQVLPEIDRLLASDRYLFDWVLIRERITGTKQGL